MCGSYPCITEVKTSQMISNFRQLKTTLVNEDHATSKACPNESGTDKFMQRFI